MWVCSHCGIKLCPRCRTAAAKDANPTPHAHATPTADLATDTVTTPAAPALLSELLAGMPQHPGLPTLARIPRGLSRRYARLRLQTLDWLLDAVDADLPVDTCAQWSQLARILPWLILHDDRDNDTTHTHRIDQGGEAPVGARRRVVDRLHMAEQGQWHTLIRQAMAAENAHQRRDRPAAAKPPNHNSAQLFARVVKHALAGSLKAAKRLLLGTDTLPPCDATTKAVLELYKSAPEQTHATLPPPPSPGPRKVSTRDVTKKLRTLRTSAQPGPNHERNAHLQDLLLSPHGALTLARWCEAWRTNTLPPAVRQHWLFSHVIALDKGGGKARPILLQETLLKLATGTIIQMHQTRIQKAVGACQHGLGGAVGAPQVVWQVRAAMANQPYATFLGIDCRNAFGTIARPAVVAEADSQVPQIATMFRAMWHHVTPRMLIRQRDGTLTDHPVVDGLAQGGCDSQPAFCLGIGRALRTFHKKCEQAHITVRTWAYVDDVVLQLPAEHTIDAVRILDEVFRDIGLERRPDKCRWFVPGPNTTADYAAEVGAPARDGLPILGSTADGAFRTIVSNQPHAGATTTQPAQDRLTQAAHLASRITDLLHSECDAPVLHAAYKLVTGTLNQALSYDICVLPVADIGTLAEQLDRLVLCALRDIIGVDWTATTEALIRLPRDHGGCGVPSVLDRAHTAFLSTILRCPPAVTTTPQAWSDAGVTAACEKSLEWLRTQGVWLDAWAMARDSPPQHDDTLTAHTLPTIPLPKRQPGWRQAIATFRAKTLRPAVQYLESRAGQEGGALLQANGGDMQVDLTDSEFRNYIRMRLGLPVCIHQKCQHRANSDAARACTQISDTLGYHALLCKLGGGLTSTHNAICSILLQAARAAGFSALKEQVVAELATTKRKEPRVDIDAWGLVAEPRVMLDVTVTSPFAQRYESKSAVKCGEHRKDNEYPRKAGLSVTGVAVDVYGKHGAALQDLLTRFADLARQHEVDSGTQPRRWLHRWRVRIATEIARGCSRQINNANTATTPTRQQPPPALAAQQQPHHQQPQPTDESPHHSTTSSCQEATLQQQQHLVGWPAYPTTTTTLPPPEAATHVQSVAPPSPHTTTTTRTAAVAEQTA